MFTYTAMTIATLLSLLCLVTVPGPFIQAALLLILLYVAFAITAVNGYLKFSLLNLFILSLALALSPITDMGSMYNNKVLAFVCLISAMVGFSGLMFGIYKLQRIKASDYLKPPCTR
jgi:hypothetical protein